MEREDVIDFLERVRQARTKAAKPREERGKGNRETAPATIPDRHAEAAGPHR